MKNNLYGYEIEDLKILMEKSGYPKYRAEQVFTWLQNKKIEDMSEAQNLPKNIRDELEENYSVFLPQVVRESVSKNGDTKKALLKMEDDETVETVLMRYKRDKARNRNTVCVSSQVGCAMSCPFCATGLSGFKRNLAAGEIIGQIQRMDKLLKEEDQEEKVTNVVFMGMGEPLQNYDNVLKSIRILNDRRGLDIGIRRITLSTCGLIPEIDRLAGENLQLVLAISLHAPNNELRNKLMPINKKYPLDQLIMACKRYIDTTGRRITFEYALIKGENDQLIHARQLASLLKGLKANVNLIPLNEVLGCNYVQSKDAEIFLNYLKSHGVDAYVREEMGSDIDAACGQLKRNDKEMR